MMDVTDNKPPAIRVVPGQQALLGFIKYGICKQNCKHDEHQDFHTAPVAKALVRLQPYRHLPKSCQFFRTCLGASGKLW